MARRKLLRGGLPRLFDDHRSPLGRLYRQAYERLLAEAGEASSAEARELAADVAELKVRATVASRQWGSTAERRLFGKGRRPTEGRLRASSKRAALDGRSYREALGEYRALLAARDGRPIVPTPRELIEQMAGDGRRG